MHMDLVSFVVAGSKKAAGRGRDRRGIRLDADPAPGGDRHRRMARKRNVEVDTTGGDRKTLKGIAIPSRPQVLVQLENELTKDDPDPRVIARLISGDVGLSAAVLKTVNSPFFGLSRRISSVAQAVSLLGMRSATQIVTGLC
jgi:hypothetical protein